VGALNKIKSDVIWIATGRLMFAFSQWLVIVYLSRTVGVEDLGLYTYSIALVSPLIMFSQMNMRMYLVTDAKDKFASNDYYSTRLLATAIALTILVMLMFFKNADYSFYICLAGVALIKAVESISDVVLGFLQKHGDMKLVSISNILKGVSSLVVMISAIYIFDSMILGVFAIAISWLMILFLYDISKCKKLSIDFSFNSKNIKDLVIVCIPLGLIMALINYGFNIPVYIIENDLGIEKVGVFSAIFYFLVMGRLVAGSVIQAIAPRVSRVFSSHDTRLMYKVFMVLVLSGFFVATIGVLIAYYVGDMVLGFVYGEVFMEYTGVFVIIMIAAGVGFINQFIGLILTSIRSFKSMLFTHGVQVLIVFVSAYMLVPIYGIEGAAQSLVYGNLVLLLLNVFVFVLHMNRTSNLRII